MLPQGMCCCLHKERHDRAFFLGLFVCLFGGGVLKVFFFVILLVGSPELLKVLHRKLELVPSSNL